MLLFALPILPILIIGALSALSTSALGVFHTGVERGWWEGPSECSATMGAGLSTDDLLKAIQSAPMVRCDEVAWSLMGLSMASWNGIFSLILAGLWIASLKRA